MTEKVFDIISDSDGWSCHEDGVRIASFPSWGLAIAAARSAADKHRRKGRAAVLRYQDLKGAMHRLDTGSVDAVRPAIHRDPLALSRIDHLAAGARPQ